MTEDILVHPEKSALSVTGMVNEKPVQPTGGSRWLLALLMLFMLLPVQLIVGIPLILVALLFITGGDFSLESVNTVMMDFATSDWAIWLTLLTAAVAAGLAIALAFIWPRLSKPGGQTFSFREWFAADPPEGWIKLYLVPPITLGVMILSGLGLNSLMGESEVSVQLLLFGTPALQIASTLVVSTFVPLAEELTFRGALYNALLGDADRQATKKRPHLLPFLITSIAFAAVHLLAGFDTIGALVQVFLLSLYITFLRWRTGSVLPSIVAHATWNFITALLLALSINLPI